MGRWIRRQAGKERPVPLEYRSGEEDFKKQQKDGLPMWAELAGMLIVLALLGATPFLTIWLIIGIKGCSK